MTSILAHSIPALWRGIAPATFCAAAVALGGATLAVSATASAEPNSGEWDIGAYDECMGYVDTEIAEGKSSGEAISRHMASCCTETGGQLGKGNVCQAPPAAPAEVRPGVLPPGVNMTLTPVPPKPAPGIHPPTLTAGPGSRG